MVVRFGSCRPRIGQPGDALAGAGLADDAEGAAPLDGERHPVDRADHAVLGVEPHPQVAHPQVGVLVGALRRHGGAVVRFPGRRRFRAVHDHLPQ